MVSSAVAKFFYDKKLNEALKNSVTVTAQIESIENTKNYSRFLIKFVYNGQVLHSSFIPDDQSIVDSLRKYPTIVIQVSKEDPVKYLKFIKFKH